MLALPLSFALLSPAAPPPKLERPRVPVWAACMELSEVDKALDRRHRISWGVFGTGVGLVAVGLAVQFIPVGACYDTRPDTPCRAYRRINTAMGLYTAGTATGVVGAFMLVTNGANRLRVRRDSRRLGLSMGPGGPQLRF